jgi:hypothetical protein
MANRWRNGYWRDDNFARIVFEAPGVKNRDGERLNSDNSLAITTVVAGTKNNRGHKRGVNGELLTADPGTPPLKFKRGYLRDANDALVTTTSLTGAVVKRGDLIAPNGALVVSIGTALQTAPQPTLTLLTPDSSGGWNQEVVVNGTNFTPDSVVISGNLVAETRYISPTELRIVVPGSLATGVYQVQVRTGDKVSVASLPYTRY